MNTKKPFGSTIRRARQKRKIGLRKMAAICDMYPTHLSRIERNEMTPPNDSVVLTMAMTLNLDATNLLRMANILPLGLIEAIDNFDTKQLEYLDLIVREAHWRKKALESPSFICRT